MANERLLTGTTWPGMWVSPPEPKDGAVVLRCVEHAEVGVRVEVRFGGQLACYELQLFDAEGPVGPQLTSDRDTNPLQGALRMARAYLDEQRAAQQATDGLRAQLGALFEALPTEPKKDEEDR